MIQEKWQAVTPQYNEYNDYIDNVASLPLINFGEAQPRLSKTVETFTQLAGLNKFLVLNVPDNAFYRSLLEQVVIEKTESKVLLTESLDTKTLFGTYSADHDGNLTVRKPGLLEIADNGFIILPINVLLANPASWPALKAAVLTHTAQAINSNPTKPANIEPAYPVACKIILVGDRSQIADLEYLEPDLYMGLALYSELELEMVLTEDTVQRYLGHISWILNHFELPPLTPEAIHRLMTAGARYSEDQRYMPLDVMWYLSIFNEAALNSNQQALTEPDIDGAFEAKYYREAYLPERARSDILDGQVIIETQGECVGQVNGLTVIEVSGHPLSYGEPARISCVIHFGDGDISDVERKAELGGNLHAKGMMIMQAFVASALNLEEPLPYSASVVFEQSYCEVDGDSATLAELCSFVSALSEYPINQQIAVTGAVDQFGKVQAVGGLNEKIEGFYHVCKHQGFTGSQGVILPKSNLKHLALHKDVVESIKNNEFHIWSVETVDQAIPIIMGQPFRGDDEDSVISKIAQRIENFERDVRPLSILERIKNCFV
ncbi:S16 family serine protease [Vibrio renipiscarius]|uniref:endopeptidase La n=1 Tax=Vibrio renipiscarius TaxID=1461322 RepID=A0A0C2P5K2_9VIBR|nr:Lon protease family protein [Vibrio renipiscarius]KII75853.1 ATP-dependent protease [Vibrio renipiscarius]KII81697.1 ATP-dependent protease [Vibrio renipiscarius]